MYANGYVVRHHGYNCEVTHCVYTLNTSFIVFHKERPPKPSRCARVEVQATSTALRPFMVSAAVYVDFPAVWINFLFYFPSLETKDTHPSACSFTSGKMLRPVLGLWGWHKRFVCKQFEILTRTPWVGWGGVGGRFASWTVS